MTDPYTTEARLCDDTGMVSAEPVTPANPLAPGLTYLQQLNNLRAKSEHTAPYRGAPFPCTGSAHLAGEHIRCTSPAHGRLAREEADLLEAAWGLICNADTRTIDQRDDEWGAAARAFRERYHAWLDRYVKEPADPALRGMSATCRFCHVPIHYLAPTGVGLWLDSGLSRWCPVAEGQRHEPLILPGRQG